MSFAEKLKDVKEEGFAEGEAKGRREGEAKGRREGEAKGRRKGGLDMLWTMIDDGYISTKIAARKCGMTEEAFLETRPSDAELNFTAAPEG